MLKILIANNIFFVRASRDLFKKGNDATPTGPTSSIVFPYKFGGVDNYPANEMGIEIFGKDNQQDFIKLYGQFLDSVVNKDKAWLRERVEDRLIEPLLSANNLKQINRELPI
jgi:hypothetical protein